MRRAKPRNSAAVTPLARSAASTAPAIAGASSASVSADSRRSASISERCTPSSSRSSTLRMAMGSVMRAQAAVPAQEIAHHDRAMRRQYALGMKLHALEQVLPMTHAHDLALGGTRRDV